MSRFKRHPAHHSRSMQPLSLPDDTPDGVAAMWGSRDHLAVLWHDQGHDRLTINSTTLDHSTLNWDDGLTWDELQQVKNQCGYGHRWAVEVYPPAGEVINDANMRHLWLLDEAPAYGWTTKEVAL